VGREAEDGAREPGTDEEAFTARLRMRPNHGVHLDGRGGIIGDCLSLIEGGI
jgi:hypothetical protein